VPQYMLLIFSDPTQGPAEGSPEAMAEWQAWGTYTQGLKDAGAFVSGEPLEAPSTATLGGFYVIEAPDLDVALEHAAGMPNIGYGHVEVRPLMQVPAM
jgi:hypothetical protein